MTRKKLSLHHSHPTATEFQGSKDFDKIDIVAQIRLQVYNSRMILSDKLAYPSSKPILSNPCFYKITPISQTQCLRETHEQILHYFS